MRAYGSVKHADRIRAQRGDLLIQLLAALSREVKSFQIVVEIVKSTKGKREMFRFAGQLYEIEKTVGHRLHCRCVRMRWESCPARAVSLKITIVLFYVLSLPEYLMKASRTLKTRGFLQLYN